MRFRLLAPLLLWLPTTLAFAQVPDSRGLLEMPADLPMVSSLYRADLLANERTWPPGELRMALRNRGLVVDDADRVHVCVVGTEGDPPIGDGLLASFGATGETGWQHRRDAWVPVAQLVALSRGLPPAYRIEAAFPPIPCSYEGEGPSVTNSDSYRDGGSNGSGMTIAIMDGGFYRLSSSQAAGDAPSSYAQINYTPEPFEAGTDEHGTNCVETLYDHCPGANFRIYKTDSDSDWPLVAQNMIDHGVDIFSVSVASTGAGWPDDSSLATEAANAAAQSGILVFCSAGNWAEQHWEGFFTPYSPQPIWHDFGGGDRFLQIVVDPGKEMRAFLQWDNRDGACDYDIYLYDAGFAFLDAAYTIGSDPETLARTNTSGSPVTWYLSLAKRSGRNAPCELFAIGCAWQEHIVSAGSTVAPGNSTHPLVFCVGAVPWEDFDSPSGTSGILLVDSSRGPSNDGMILPDVVGPTWTTVGWGDHPPFGGTSCAAPNVAGAACAFYSADPQLSPYAIAWLVKKQAAAWRDWGIAGEDNLYGNGGILLYDYVPGTLWVSRSYGNVNDNRAYPLYHVSSAHALAPPGGRLLFFLGGTYPEVVTLTKSLRSEAAAGMVTIGP